MRLACWVVVGCAVLSAIGLFVPSLEVRAFGYRLSRRTSVSLYQVHEDRDLVRKLLVAYNRSERRATAARLTSEMLDHVAGRLKEHVSDAHDALTSLDDVSDDDVRTVDRILAAAILAFLLVQTALVSLVASDAIRGVYRKRRTIAALVIATLAAAMAIAIHVACRMVRFEANDDLGRDAVVLAGGAYLIPAGAIFALLGMIAYFAHKRGTSPP